MKQASEPTKPSNRPKFGDALAVLAIVLLTGLITAEGVWYFLGTGFYTILAASFVLGVGTPFARVEETFLKIFVVTLCCAVIVPIVLFLGLIVAVSLHFFFGGGFQTTLTVSLFLGILSTLVALSTADLEGGGIAGSWNAKPGASADLRGRFAKVGAMSSTGFVEFVADVLRARYEVTLMGPSHERGVNLLLLDSVATPPDSIAVRCENQSRPVDERPVRKAHEGAKQQQAGRAWVVSLHGFTKGAFELADRLDVLLIGASGIRTFINQIDAGTQSIEDKKDLVHFRRLLQAYRGYLDALEESYEAGAQGGGDLEDDRGAEARRSEAYVGIRTTLRDLSDMERRYAGLPVEERAMLLARQAQIEREEKLREEQRRVSERKLREEREEQRRRKAKQKGADEERMKREQEAKQREAKEERRRREQEKKRREEAGQSKGRAGGGHDGHRRSSGDANRRKDMPAHEILRVAPDASHGEIVAAYRKMALQYHPDRVSGLGPEFGELAERRMKEINAAYSELQSKKR